MAEHTPTWYVEPDELDGLFKISEVEYGTIAWEVEGAERAHKLAAAPELLAALQHLCERYSASTTPEWVQARAAVAKAQGQSHG